MMQAVRGFNEQLERIGEVAVVLVVGAMLAFTTVAASTAWFVLLLFVGGASRVGIVLHGISVTPLMDLYARRKARRSGR